MSNRNRSPLLAKWQKLTFAFNGLQANINALNVSSMMITDLYNDVGLEIQRTEKVMESFRVELAELKKQVEALTPKEKKKVNI